MDEIYLGKQMKFITVVSNLETGEPLWFGQNRKQETLDEFFRTQLSGTQPKHIEAACVDMWRPFTSRSSLRGLLRKLPVTNFRHQRTRFPERAEGRN